MLEELGAVIEQTDIPNASCVVEDRELLTGQDPSSAQDLGTRFVAKVRAANGLIEMS